MKNFKCGIILLLACVVFSCIKDDLKYSCNSEVDEYVLENQIFLKSIGLTELSTFDDEVQRAAYRSFTTQKKYELWYNKFEVLIGGTQFNVEEQEHLAKLQQQLNYELFVNDNTDAFIRFMKFYSVWQYEAYNDLGWDKTFVNYIISSLSIYYDDYLNNTVEVYRSIIMSSQRECDCKRSNDACANGFYCKDTNCVITTEGGCGLLWLQDCDGTCSTY